MIKQIIISLSQGIFILIVISCNNNTNKEQNNPNTSSSADATEKHGYNELANPDERETSSVSDYNTDNAEIKNIVRPTSSVIETSIDTALLYTSWTSDPDGPHADFVFSKRSFYVVDYDGDGDMPYELTDTKLKIYYNDFVQEGEIVSVGNDTLKILWNEYDREASYVRWKN